MLEHERVSSGPSPVSYFYLDTRGVRKLRKPAVEIRLLYFSFPVRRWSSFTLVRRITAAVCVCVQGQMCVRPQCFHTLTHMLMSLAEGRLVLALEVKH